MQTEFHSAIAKALYPILHGIARDKENFQFVEHANGHTVEIQVAAGVDDIGNLSGRGGRTALSIQRLVTRYGANEGKHCTFSIRSNHLGTFTPRAFMPDPDFETVKLRQLLDGVCEAIAFRGKLTFIPRPSDNQTDVFITTTTERDRSVVPDLNALFYPWGWVNGRLVKIKNDCTLQNEPDNSKPTELA